MACLIMEMESKPFTDVLGLYYLEVGSKLSQELRGEFYTPQSISGMMARMLVDVDSIVAKGAPMDVNDPTCGAAGMILSLAEQFARTGAVDLLRATCQDIAKVACDMAYVNLTLWGVPARVIWGDTLRMTGEKEWKNIHCIRVGEERRQALLQTMRMVRESPDQSLDEPPEGRADSTDSHAPLEQTFLFDGPDPPEL